MPSELKSSKPMPNRCVYLCAYMWMNSGREKETPRDWKSSYGMLKRCVYLLSNAGKVYLSVCAYLYMHLGRERAALRMERLLCPRKGCFANGTAFVKGQTGVFICVRMYTWIQSAGRKSLPRDWKSSYQMLKRCVYF